MTEDQVLNAKDRLYEILTLKAKNNRERPQWPTPYYFSKKVVVIQNDEIQDLIHICKSQYDMVQSLLKVVPTANLENCKPCTVVLPEEENDPMAYNRIRVNIGNDADGKPIYTKVGGSTQDERNDNIVKAYIRSGRIFDFLPETFSGMTPIAAPAKSSNHGFKDYATHWFEVFSKPTVEESTAITYKRQLDLYWFPAFGSKAVEDIAAADIQAVLNGMGDVSKDTRKKAMLVLGMVLDQAVEDGFVNKNVSKSKTIKVTGKASKETEPYSVEQMQYLVAHIPDIKNPTDRAYLALAALHPLRPEEEFGLQYGDIDRENSKISIQRAVTYPDRNQPLIKGTKTEHSVRVIDLAPQILQYLPDGEPGEYIFGGEKPLSYQQIRRMRMRIKKDIGFEDEIVPRRFRTTVLTDIYDVTKDIKQAQEAAGHTNASTTLKHYVKGRKQNFNTAAPVANRYGLTNE